MQALSTKSDTKILARPRIITLNNESAVINVTAQTAVASLTQTTTAEGPAVSSADTPERLTTGILLAITPQINDDGYITMLVAPEVTIPVASDFFPTKFVDPQTRSARSIIRVKDGDTLVIAGLLKEEANKISDTIKNKELIVFITPRIVYDEKTPKPKKETAKVALSKKVEVAPLVPKVEKEIVAPKEKVIPKPEKQVVAPKETKESIPAKRIDSKSREEAMERALDQLSQNNKKIPNGKNKPTDQI
jgi:type II secretory pathway component GspD/PulD (secretin)